MTVHVVYLFSYVWVVYLCFGYPFFIPSFIPFFYSSTLFFSFHFFLLFFFIFLINYLYTFDWHFIYPTFPAAFSASSAFSPILQLSLLISWVVLYICSCLLCIYLLCIIYIIYILLFFQLYHPTCPDFIWKIFRRLKSAQNTQNIAKRSSKNSVTVSRITVVIF